MLKILVVDDADMIRINLISFLEDEGYTVQGAASAEEALELLNTFKPNWAIVDMRLPGKDGNFFIINAKAVLPQLNIIIHTGSSDYILPDALKKLGITAASIIRKPVADMQVFINLIKEGAASLSSRH